MDFSRPDERQVLRRDPPPVAEDDRPLEHVLQLPNVAGPVVYLKQVECRGFEDDLGPGRLPAEALDEVLAEDRDVLPTFAEGGQAKRNDEEPAEEVPAVTVLPRLVPVLAALAAFACSSVLEVPVETPLQSKLDVSAFRRILIAGFVTDLETSDVDLSAETSRLLQNQLRSNTRLQVLEPDRPPLAPCGPSGSRSASEQVLEGRPGVSPRGGQGAAGRQYWRKLGEVPSPLIVTGRLGFEEQNRSGFQTEERVVRDSGNRPRLVRGNRYLERKGYALSADFYFLDGRTGQLLHKEKFTEEVLYGEEQKISPLSSYFELMDRLLPNFLGVISPQKIRGTRVLLR
jgi:hypothetical protein